MTIHLSPDLERIVESKVKSGHYNSASEVVRDAIRLLAQRDEVFTLRDGEVRAQIEEGWRSAADEDVVDGGEAFDRIDTELKVMERSARK